MASNSKKRRRSPRKAKAKTKAPAVMGRPPYEPTKHDRHMVRQMAALGINHAIIGRALSVPCSDVTLRVHFREELDAGRPRWMHNIAEMLFTHLNGRPAQYDSKGKLMRKELDPKEGTAIFLSKVTLGLREKVDMTDRDGRPLVTEDMLVGLPEDEQEQLIVLLRKARAAHAAQVDASDSDARRYETLPVANKAN